MIEVEVGKCSACLSIGCYCAYCFLYICLPQVGWHPVAVVHYTFTHKQCTKQHNETEYKGHCAHNNTSK
jgi:hypothetical protein